MKKRFTNSKLNESIPRKNESKLIFEKCSFKIGKEKASFITFRVQFLTPKDSIVTNIYNKTHTDISFGDIITSLTKNEQDITLNKTINIPKESTIINISFHDTLNFEFDLELYFSIV